MWRCRKDAWRDHTLRSSDKPWIRTAVVFVLDEVIKFNRPARKRLFQMPDDAVGNLFHARQPAAGASPESQGDAIQPQDAELANLLKAFIGRADDCDVVREFRRD